MKRSYKTMYHYSRLHPRNPYGRSKKKKKVITEEERIGRINTQAKARHYLLHKTQTIFAGKVPHFDKIEEFPITSPIYLVNGQKCQLQGFFPSHSQVPIDFKCDPALSTDYLWIRAEVVQS